MLREIINDEIKKISIEENDIYYENLLFNNSLNESVSTNDIVNYINKIFDKRSLLKKAITRFNKNTNRQLKGYLLLIILIVVSKYSYDSTVNYGDMEKIANQESARDSIDYNTVANLLDSKGSTVEQIDNYTISNMGIDLIKKHEAYRDKAYKIGDGMITIGYGHAEKINASKYKLGDVITRTEAENLLSNDVLWAENGVKRILKKVINKNPKLHINQNMFDALVSMAYNMGVSGLLNTDFVQKLTVSSNPLDVAELIKTARIGKWEGLKKRRQAEYNLFVKK